MQISFEGQYIVKNLALIGGGIVLGGTVRGGRLIAGEGDEWGGLAGKQTDSVR